MRTPTLCIPGGDPSLAAPLIVAAALVRRPLFLPAMMVTERRMEFARFLMRLGVEVKTFGTHPVGAEMVADVRLMPEASLYAVGTLAHETPRLGEDIWAAAVLASRGRGLAVFQGLGPKADDVVAYLEDLDVRADHHHDDLRVWGTRRPLRGHADSATGGVAVTMLSFVLARIPGFEVEAWGWARDMKKIERVYPTFEADLENVLRD